MADWNRMAATNDDDDDNDNDGVWQASVLVEMMNVKERHLVRTSEKEEEEEC